MVNVLVGLLFKARYSSKVSQTLKKNLVNYTNYIINDIGVPPDTLRAKKFAQEFALQIHYEGVDRSWATSDIFPPREKILTKKDRSDSGSAFWINNIFVVFINENDYFLFRHNIGPHLGLSGSFLLSLFLLVSVVFIGAHIIIRRMLIPVRWLAAGVQQIREENLDYQIPVRGSDEFSGLTEAFNDMFKRIKQMLLSRDRLLLDVSHELRSPITRMKVAIELLPESAEKKRIGDDLVEMETMITEILETERLKNGYGKLNLQEKDLTEIIKDVSKEFKQSSPGIRLDEMLKSVKVKIDPDRVTMVIKNLLNNAVKYSCADSKPIEISIVENNDSVIVKVKDDGQGVPDKDLPHIFEPFYRVDQSRSKENGGYGLGLSLCKKIMEAHNGQIKIQNNAQRGITAELIFKY